jgi:hypothetical protein
MTGWHIQWVGFWRKRSWPTQDTILEICLEGPRRNQSLRILGVLAEKRTMHYRITATVTSSIKAGWCRALVSMLSDLFRSEVVPSSLRSGLDIDLSLTHSLTHGAEPFLRSRQLCSCSRTSQHFMDPGGSLPCSQEPFTGPYPEPDQSNPYRPILSKILFLSNWRTLNRTSFMHRMRLQYDRESGIYKDLEKDGDRLFQGKLLFRHSLERGKPRKNLTQDIR